MSNLKKAKVGDSVVLVDNKIITVERITKTLIITNSGRFRIKDGMEVGGCVSWRLSLNIKMATAEEIERIEEDNIGRNIRRNLLNKVVHFKGHSKLSTDDLKIIADIFSAVSK